MAGKKICISGRNIGKNYIPLVIAEIGINHGGDFNTAIKMIDSAKRAGVKIVKFQCHIVEEEMSTLAKNTIPGNSKESIWNIMKRCELKEEEEIRLKEYVESQGMIYLSTPFSFAAIDRLEKMNIAAYKIGSGEMNNLLFVETIAKKNKPIIISTGMNDINMVKRVIGVIEKYHKNYVIMHTTNLYPTNPKYIRLGALKEIENIFGENNIIVGLSDHTLNNNACIAAMALGASVVERHYTDTKDRIGEDIVCSMDEEECRELIQAAKEIFLMRNGSKNNIEEEDVTRQFAFSTVVTKQYMSKGERITLDKVTTKRPGIKGIYAYDIHDIIGKKINKNIKKDNHIEWQDIEG